VKFLAGERRKETIHTESGLRVNVNIEKMYFSARLAEERLRIARQIRKPERILVMFSGCGIYPLVLAAHSPAQHIIGIEINPVAHRYAVENVHVNKLTRKIQLVEGDVWDIVPALRGTFDRICMPLPKIGEQFLPLTFRKIRDGGIIHLYAFINDNDIEEEKRKLKEILRDSHKKYRILRIVKCGQHAPFVHRYCFDIKMLSS
jgi:tRNA G37 N-methylase Trm5